MTSRQRGWLLPPAAASLVAGVFIGRVAADWWIPLIACLLGLSAVLLLKGLPRWLACLALSLALGTLSGSLAFHPSLPAEGDYQFQGIISGEISTGSFGQLRIPLSSVQIDGKPFSGGAYWTFYPDEAPADLLPGKEVSFRASLYHPDDSDNPGGYNFRESLLQRGILIGVYGGENLEICEPERFSLIGSVAALRHRLSASLIRTMGEESGSYASALLLGMRSLVPSEDHDAFSKLGIAHILSVSGFHVGILISVLALLFRLLRLSQPVRLVLYILVCSFYAALCGMNQPVIRASLFFLLFTEGRILNRTRSGLHIFSAALFLMVLFSPTQVTSASFQLTFCAMLGLFWFTPLAGRISENRNRVVRVLLRSSVLTFGVQLGLLFPELLWFQRLPLLCFVINYPATLIASVLIILDWAVLLLLPVPGLAALLSAPVTQITSGLLEGIRSLGSLPGLTLWIHAPTWLTALGILLFLFGFCSFLRIRRIPRLLLSLVGCAAVVVSLLPVPHTLTEYIQLSAGNADAAVLWDQDRVIVMDAGEADGTLSGFLRYHRLIPDTVVLTHLHADHAGGLLSMMEDEIPIRRILIPSGAEKQDVHPDILALLSSLRASGTEILELTRGDVLPLPSGVLTVLWPEADRIRPEQDANHYSLVSRLMLKGTVLLQTGDLSGSYEMYSATPADILKAAHHGSPSSTSDAFLEAVSPRAILLSCAGESRLNSFRERCGNIPVFGTAECGAVTIRFDENGFSVLPHKTWPSPEETDHEQS